MEGPNWSALGAMVGDLRKTLDNVDDTQRRMAKVTATAWSEDRLIKAVVGARGHLLELDLDPRLFRKPNSKALSAAILATVREAIKDVLRQNREIVEETVPRDLRVLTDVGAARFTYKHDADVIAELEEEEDDG